VQIVSSQISGLGASVAHRWDRYRLTSTAIDLAVDGRLQVLPLITHTISLAEAADAFRMLDANPGDAMQVVIDMSTP
jgi:threonine dehydrogenase-like Zn-dependent dehydrogenase